MAEKTVGLVFKPGVPQARAAFQSIRAQLSACRLLVEHDAPGALPLPDGCHAVSAEQFGEGSDLVLVFGGDGTMIHAASLLHSRSVPILGVNLGRLGFLTSVAASDLAAVLPKALSGELPHSDRMRLDAELWRADNIVLKRRILNDAVLSTKALARIATYRVSLGEELVTLMRGDGVIVSTPTGSTAYSLAAGGSILAPGVLALAITPICPHAVTQRPVVVSPEPGVTVTLESETTVFATLDGQAGHEFARGDRLVVTRAPVPTRLLVPSERSYFHTLRSKLNWGEA